MDLYFSGLKSPNDIDIVYSAGVKLVLVDQFDYVKNKAHLLDKGFKIALDSGAYRAFKQGQTLDPVQYLDLIRNADVDFEFVVTLDVIGSPEQTYKIWKEHFLAYSERLKIIPVWHWGTDASYLEKYLNQSPLVGIGGLVTLMREKNASMLKNLKKLLKNHPGRFHLFGINWLKAINHCHTLLNSGDTSKFLDGGRYGTVIHMQTSKKGTRFLNDCRAIMFEECENCFDISARTRQGRYARCLLSAKNMNNFVKLQVAA